MKVALYARVSTEYQDTRGQLLRLRDLAKVNDWIVVGEFEDHASGADASRPRFDEMMLGVRQHQFDAIIVTKLDRIMRSLVGLENLVTELDRFKISLICIDQGIDTAAGSEDGTKKLVRRILGAVAEWEREMIRSRVKEGIAKARRVGTRSGKPFGRPLRGYEVEGRKREKVSIEEIERALREEPKISQVRLARKLGIPRTTLRDYLARMTEKEGVGRI